MKQYVLIIVVTIIFELISETPARRDNYHLSEKQTLRLRDIATYYRQEINIEKDPCEEFYDFVCSNNSDSHLRPNWKYPEDYLEEVFNTKSELFTETEEKYFKYFTTCKQFNQNEKVEFAKSFKFENSIGNWPAFDEKWDDSKFNFSLAIAEMTSYGYDIFFSHKFMVDDDLKTYLRIRQVDFNTIKDAKQSFEYLFWRFGVQNPEDVLADAILFEETYNEAVESIKLTPYQKFQFSELKKYLPEMDWDKHIEVVYGGKLSDDYPIFLESQERQKKILTAVSKLTPKVIANYFFCVFVHELEYLFGRTHMFFMSVERQIFMKYIYSEDKKEILKGMYIKYLEILQDKNMLYNFDIHYSSDEIVKFVNEDIFEITNETYLAKEFNEISASSDECVKNHHRLMPFYKKRLAEPVFSKPFGLLSVLKNQIIKDLVDEIPKYIDEPSSVLIESIIASSLISNYDNFLNTALSIKSAPNECFAKQFREELTNHERRILLVVQIILKVFAEWSKTHPQILQNENKILEEYDLTSGKLLTISLGKQSCDGKGITTAFANSVEFSQIFNCSYDSKMNIPKKCRFLRD